MRERQYHWNTVEWGSMNEFRGGKLPEIKIYQADDHETLAVQRLEIAAEIAEIAETRQLYQKLLENAKATGNLPEDRQCLKERFIDFATAHLGWSPCNFSSLPLIERLDLAVAFSRIPEAQGTISQTFVVDISYSLAFSSEDTSQFLTDQIIGLPIEDQIDTTLYLSTLGANALAQGHEDQAVKTIKDTLQALEDEAFDNPFLKYAVAQTWQEIEAEEEEPTRGVVIRTGDRSVGRRGGVLTQADAAEMKLFKRKIQPVGNSTNGAYLRVARDAIAIIDHALFPQNIALTHQNFEAGGESDAQYEDAVQLITFIKQSSRAPASAIPKALLFADQHLLPESKLKIEAWHDIHPDLSSDEWAEFWKVYQELNQLVKDRDERVSHEQKAAEQRNLEDSMEFIRLTREAAQHLPSNPPYATLIEGLKSEDFETQFRFAENLAMIARYQPDAPDAILHIAQLAQDVERFHRQSFKQAREAAEAIFATQEKLLTPLHAKLSPYFERFQKTDLLASLTTHAESLLKDDDRVKMEFHGYQEVVPAGKVLVGGQKKTSDTALLLQEIHRPAIRRGLEQDLGVSLRDLSVREQLQLIPFLAQASPDTQKRTFLLTQQFGTAAAQAFLSGEYGEEFFEAVLVIGEQQKPEVGQRIFERYAEISSIAQEAVNEIANASLQGTNSKLDPQLLQKELLTRAKTLLEAAAKPDSDHNSALQALESAKAETVLFASICKTYFKNNPEAKLEDIRGINLDSFPSGNISDSDQQQMETMLRTNWAKRPELVENLVGDLRNKMANPNAHANFYILKQDHRLVGFLSFSKEHPEAKDGVYGDSFNIQTDVNNSGLGTAMLARVIDQESSKHPVYAHVDPNSPAFKLYTQRFGFQAIGEENELMPDGSKVRWVKIRRYDKATSPALS